MKKLSYGLLAAVAIALATAPAEAATKKKKDATKKKDKAEVAQSQSVHPMGFTCYLNAWVGAKQPKACGG